ncbi:MAG TPA: CPBP family glutamic-type intramembrane protease [Myxococcota bacterium]|nr:CPBP family glutamic-type intramembrane protease [Myxococcota bacterium]HPV04059.1 CPBP family glutamic-type intramembrane protease [Myxococcota bacterium]
MDVFAGSGTVRPVPGRLIVRGRLARKAAAAGRKAGRRAPKPAAKGIAGYFQSTKAVGTSLVLTLPVLLLYNVSLIVPANDTINTVDLLSRIVGTRYGMYGLLVANSIIGLVSLVLGVVLAKRGRLKWWYWALLVVEGAAWAVLVAAAGYWANTGLGQTVPSASIMRPNANYSLMQILTFSAGAGYWEELVFRLGVIGVPFGLARWFSGRPGGSGGLMPAVVAGVMLFVSAIVFSSVHYIGVQAHFDTWSFVFRAVAGLVFGLLFLFRGFSVAVFAHFMYDIAAFWLG